MRAKRLFMLETGFMNQSTVFPTLNGRLRLKLLTYRLTTDA